jgi:hypothetical protein
MDGHAMAWHGMIAHQSIHPPSKQSRTKQASIHPAPHLGPWLGTWSGMHKKPTPLRALAVACSWEVAAGFSSLI